MKFRFCPFCSSEKIALMNEVITPEEERHTEIYGCFTCKKIVLREMTSQEELEELKGFESVN